MRKVKFTKHAVDRAKERGLLPYINKKKFWYEALHLDNDKAVLDNVIYALDYHDGRIYITTIYKKDLP